MRKGSARSPAFLWRKHDAYGKWPSFSQAKSMEFSPRKGQPREWGGFAEQLETVSASFFGREHRFFVCDVQSFIAGELPELFMLPPSQDSFFLNPSNIFLDGL
jgi:hypothetical protein